MPRTALWLHWSGGCSGPASRIAIPHGFECQIRPRSGLALKHGITLPNTPATIDSDYRGELMVALVNLGQETFQVTRGMRIAQLVFARVEHGGLREVAELPATARGDGWLRQYRDSGRLGG